MSSATHGRVTVPSHDSTPERSGLNIANRITAKWRAPSEADSVNSSIVSASGT